MAPELFYLVLSVGLCGVLWVPTVIERVIRIGLTETVGNNPDTKDLPSWVERLKRTHRNLVDNIVIFGTTLGSYEVLFIICAFIILVSMNAFILIKEEGAMGVRTFLRQLIFSRRQLP